MKYLLIFFYSLGAVAFHGGDVAEYHLQLRGQDLTLRFMIDNEELMDFDFDEDCDIESMTALCTVQYLNKHSFIQINGKIVEFELQNSYTEGHHLIILLHSKFKEDVIEEIVIQNQCFYEQNKRFKNRIIMDVDRFQKSYLLSRDHDKIEFR